MIKVKAPSDTHVKALSSNFTYAVFVLKEQHDASIRLIYTHQLLNFPKNFTMKRSVQFH